MILEVQTRADLLKAYNGREYVDYEEAKCFWRIGDIVRIGELVTQVIGICTGGVAMTKEYEQLRMSSDAELLWRAYDPR